MICANCGINNSEEAKFCGQCGASLKTSDVSSAALASTGTNELSETLLTTWKRVSKYRGTPVAGYSESAGTLSIFDNRLEFCKKMGGARSSGSSVLGMALSVGLARTKPAEIFELEQIAEVKEGKYMGIYNTLVVVLKDGDTWSFCPALPGSSEPKKIIALLKPYMQR